MKITWKMVWIWFQICSDLETSIGLNLQHRQCGLLINHVSSLTKRKSYRNQEMKPFGLCWTIIAHWFCVKMSKPSCLHAGLLKQLWERIYRKVKQRGAGRHIYRQSVMFHIPSLSCSGGFSLRRAALLVRVMPLIKISARDLLQARGVSLAFTNKRTTDTVPFVYLLHPCLMIFFHFETNYMAL